MCIWVVASETKTPGYPSPERKFWKKIFLGKFQGAIRTALGLVNIRPNARADSGLRPNEINGRSCADPMLVRIEGSKNELVAMPKTIKTFRNALISTLRNSLITIIIACNVAVMFANP